MGYQVWRAGKAHADQSLVITEEDALLGIREAMGEFGDAVHEAAVADLPLRALEYLLAMTQDEGVSATAVIAERLQVSPTSLTSYRRLLIQRQVIEQTARGYVKFSIPYMGEYLVANRETLLARYGRRDCFLALVGVRGAQNGNGEFLSHEVHRGQPRGHHVVAHVQTAIVLRVHAVEEAAVIKADAL